MFAAFKQLHSHSGFQFLVPRRAILPNGALKSAG